MAKFDHPSDLIVFQLNIARRWYSRAESSPDVFAKFLFFFAAFNAIFFLWKRIDNLNARDSDKRQIENVLKKLAPQVCEGVLATCTDSVAFFSERPLKRMDTGDSGEGEGYQRVLADQVGTSEDRLTALAEVLYLVRCNLAHGSKSDDGDDKHIIEAATPALQAITREVIKYTKAAPGG